MNSWKEVRAFDTRTSLSKSVAKHVAEKIKHAVREKKQFVLGCATGETPREFYRELLVQFQKNPLDLSRFFTINLDEYYPMRREDLNSYYQYMLRNVWKPLENLSPTFDHEKQASIPNGEAGDATNESIRYEREIEKRGGVDLQILGVGQNGHIGFNEPGSSPQSKTRCVKLSDSTRLANSRYFSRNVQRVPKRAITMGIATILKAREIAVLVSGGKKAEIVRKLLHASVPDPNIPATYLLMHPRVTLFLEKNSLSA